MTQKKIILCQTYLKMNLVNYFCVTFDRFCAILCGDQSRVKPVNYFRL